VPRTLPVGCPSGGSLHRRSTACPSRYAASVTAAAPKTRDEFLAAPLAELVAYWLDLRCDATRCTKVVCAPLRLLAEKHGRRRRLDELIARLRCAQCGERPVRVCITDSPISAGGQHIAPTALWSVTLVS